jgi:hypothetical protein
VEPFRIFQPNDCRFQATWNDPSGSNQQEYLSSLSDSKYCPIMAGNNQETFRLYEALEAGTLPVTTIKDKEYLEWIEKEMGLSALYHWNDPMKVWTENLGSDAIQQKVRQRWLEWKKRIQTAIQPLTVGHAS